MDKNSARIPSNPTPKVAAVSSSPGSFKLAHAAFGVGCEVMRIRAMLCCLTTAPAADREALQRGFDESGRFICKYMPQLKSHIAGDLVAGVIDFVKKELLSAAPKSRRSKKKKRVSKRPSPDKSSSRSVATQWEEWVMALGAEVSTTSDPFQSWFQLGSDLGMIEYATQANPNAIVSYLEDSATRVSILMGKQIEIPAILKELKFLDLTARSYAIAERIRRIDKQKSVSEMPCFDALFQEWNHCWQVVKAVSNLSLSIRESLQTMAERKIKLRNDERDKFMYEQRCMGRSLIEILQLVNANP